jgi:hypothetical protein
VCIVMKLCSATTRIKRLSLMAGLLLGCSLKSHADDIFTKMEENRLRIEKGRDDLLKTMNHGAEAPPSDAGIRAASSLDTYFLLRDIFCDADQGYTLANELFKASQGRLWQTKDAFVKLVTESYKRRMSQGEEKSLKKYREFLHWLGAYVLPTDSEEEIQRKISTAVEGVKATGCTEKSYLVVDSNCFDLNITTLLGQGLRFRFDTPVDRKSVSAPEGAKTQQVLKGVYHGDSKAQQNWVCGPT